MTAAHAFEYEVPEHAPAPVEAVERAEHGNVVYLTRRGQRVAAVVPPEQAQPDELVIQVAVKAVTDMVNLDPDRARATLTALLEKAGTPANEMQRRFRDEIEDLLDDLDSSAAAKDRLARYRAGEPAVSWEQAMRELDL